MADLEVLWGGRDRLLKVGEVAEHLGVSNATVYEPAYQLVRSLLLGYRTVREHELGITEARTVVVCPDANDSYLLLPADHVLAAGNTISVDKVMRERVLAVPARLRVLSQRQLLNGILARGASTPEGWADYHRDRYAWR